MSETDAALGGVPIETAHAELRQRLIDAGRLIPTVVAGLYGRDAEFEAVVAGVDAAVCRAGADEHATSVEFPPLLPKVDFDRIGYLRNFPQLVGPVFTFDGDAAAHKAVVERLDAGESYADLMSQTELALRPACCYPVYPSVAGTLPEGGRVFETIGYCFRHEPSVDPMRMQAFRQREHIRIGAPEDTRAWRALWLERAPDLLSSFGLDVISDFANDPFFGRAGRLLKMSQLEQELKVEFLVNVYGDEHRTACSSINDHQEHFGHLFGITTADGADAHSSCIGFGVERVAVALFAAHGTDSSRWPANVRGLLDLS